MDDVKMKNIEKRIGDLEKRLANYGKLLYDLLATLDERSRGFEDLREEFHNNMNKES